MIKPKPHPPSTRKGYAEDAAMAMLAKVVSGTDGRLSIKLSERARQLGYNPQLPDPSKPDGPNKSSAVAMPIPEPPIKTDAVA